MHVCNSGRFIVHTCDPFCRVTSILVAVNEDLLDEDYSNGPALQVKLKTHYYGKGALLRGHPGKFLRC
jgi:hypothetical protein